MALRGVKVIEFAGLAPGPFAGLVLADWGADVVRVDRPGKPSADILCRNKRSVVVDVKTPNGHVVLRRLVAQADVLIDPFRPGVMERLGLGPGVFLGEKGLNRRLVYARLAGFKPTGPHKDMAGHDINYLALSGVLSMFPGDADKPAFPLNILADFAGGGLTCALGILLALIERQSSGLGQVVETDMVSGSRYLSSYPLITAMRPPSTPAFAHSVVPLSPPASSPSSAPRMQHTLDGGAPFYNIYTCADGRWMSVGCLEAQFFKAFLERFAAALPAGFVQASEWVPTTEGQYSVETWPAMKAFFEQGFRLYDRDHWAAVFHGSDACALPVLSPAEAAALAASAASKLVPSSDSKRPSPSALEAIPVPHPRLSRTPARPTNQGSSGAPLHGGSTLVPGTHTDIVLREIGLTERERRRFALDGALGPAARDAAAKSVSAKL